MQKYKEINGNDYVKNSRTTINETMRSIQSMNSGTAFPTTNLFEGMKCYRTDLKKTYTLTDVENNTWVEDAHAELADEATHAASATKLRTPRALNLSGAVTADAASFDGTADATINVKTLDASKLKGTTSVSTTGNAATATKLATARTIALSGDATGSTTFDGSGNATISTTVNESAHAVTATQVVATAPEGGLDVIHAIMGDNDAARVRVYGDTNNGALEIATGDDGTEPIYARQYKNSSIDKFTTVARTAAILDTNGNTSFPGTVTAPAFSGALNGNAATASRLASPRTLSLTGKAAGSTSFDGSANASINVKSVSADTASKLSTARKISITGNATGAAAFDGSSDISINVNVNESKHAGAADVAKTLESTDANGAKSNAKFYWVGEDGQPRWLWGSNTTPSETYVYNPSNFHVSAANNDGNGANIANTYVKKAGDTVSGDLTVSGNLYAHKLRGGSDGYRHAVDWGYAMHDRVDFYEYGGTWNFWKNINTDKAGGTLCGSIMSTGWNGNVVGNVTGNSATATKLQAPRTISLSGNASGSANFDGSGNVSISTTVNESKHAAAANALDSNGNKTAIKDGTREPLNLSLYQVYSNGYPAPFGNLLSIGGAGGGELLAEWSGKDKGIGHLYYRNRRDRGNLWSDWRTVAFTSDINSFAPTKTGDGASGTWPISISGNAASATNADKLDGYHASDIIGKIQDITPKTAAAIGQFRELVVNDSHQVKLPDGGTWAYFCYTYNSWSGGDSNGEQRTRTGAGIAAGGTVIHTDDSITSNTINAFKLSGTTGAGGADGNTIIVGGFCWRIA